MTACAPTTVRPASPNDSNHLRKTFTKLHLASGTELVRMGVPSGATDLVALAATRP